LLLATWSLRCGQCRCKFGLCEEKTSRMSNEIRAYKLPKWEIVILKACLLKLWSIVTASSTTCRPRASWRPWANPAHSAGGYSFNFDETMSHHGLCR
jgi:hypothetical protein